jgi:hypothetical protein
MMKINVVESFVVRTKVYILKIWPSRDEALPCLGLALAIVLGLVLVAIRIC